MHTPLGRVSATVVSALASRAAAFGVGQPPTDINQVRRVAGASYERVLDHFKNSWRAARETKARALNGGSK